jgi:hypothetical protein
MHIRAMLSFELGCQWGIRLHFGHGKRRSGAHTLPSAKPLFAHCLYCITGDAQREEFVIFIAAER